MRRVLWILWLMLIASGCAAHPKDKPAILPQEEEVQSLSEKQMVLLFQGLMQMDKKEGLGLSRSQAETLLPIVRKNSSEGVLTSADQKKIIDVLNPEQKQYFDDFQERARKKMQKAHADRARLEELSESERERLVNDFKQQRKDRDGEPTGPPPPARKPTGEEPPSGKNVEQQLIELLESRVKK